MAEIQKLELNIGPMMREAMISSIADIVDAVPQYRYAVILELLRRDDLSRVLLAEALGERALLERSMDAEHQERMDNGSMPEGSYTEKTWDDISKIIIAELQDTPGGRAEVE